LNPPLPLVGRHGLEPNSTTFLVAESIKVHDLIRLGNFHREGKSLEFPF